MALLASLPNSKNIKTLLGKSAKSANLSPSGTLGRMTATTLWLQRDDADVLAAGQTQNASQMECGPWWLVITLWRPSGELVPRGPKGEKRPAGVIGNSRALPARGLASHART